ncbi:hypothetical protein DAPPUDRAFT_246550 [Daphnia pulex]|uniref:Fucosyltransferase n=1 Tax=Daphnia pulex TaxID=6669 RepID=E9GQR4_DAPPU|nr:hypothetical protein DAPPUDRAFT_246523 [Daphnia pulex]EFX78174.1 hypothetical protein DAPPUDRAFT_246550 [Daphnia pulex]|eukprot:EFX78160.1 hypothetical protein DAPPUDRAFT_246523 [Daphnia pulex]
MAADIVPIVYGGADYSAYAPPSSSTLTREISNRQKPATLLLDVNEVLYCKYFYWKIARNVTILNRNPKSTRI